MKTATLLKSNLDGFSGIANLYCLSEPVFYDEYDNDTLQSIEKSTEYVIVSGVRDAYICETYIFPANEDGKILSWSELDGSFQGSVNHKLALNYAGFEVR